MLSSLMSGLSITLLLLTRKEKINCETLRKTVMLFSPSLMSGNSSATLLTLGNPTGQCNESLSICGLLAPLHAWRNLNITVSTCISYRNMHSYSCTGAESKSSSSLCEDRFRQYVSMMAILTDTESFKTRQRPGLTITSGKMECNGFVLSNDYISNQIHALIRWV